MRTAERILAEINRVASERAALYRQIDGYGASDHQRRRLADLALANERLYAELRAVRCGPKQGPGEALKRFVRRASRRCKIPGCDRKHAAHGYCQLHYERIKRNGDPYLARRPNHNLPAASPYRRVS